ncbi:MotA/TolQ/ExbB proton channel family protein|uniref:Outer membrane transport energization protein ExbB n=1 Tax=Dendrosporobacter quercicolus TaxID=146817 RepID=A0A1G9TRA0_9FIRM|nr:MotA/TolQ/ExbB proton channel family protein [Dendrosporobacter quercicolus]NSL48883.1 MotA/TolQ/ExbB proton channel family protein [Dendrosporobacter quercicolus DSM 1736]SDM50088.1 outer membrane transport energization protein ExbB [Dendrosporobacter quercicolus]
MLEILIKGGWVMAPLGLCSIVAGAVIVERFFYFRKIKAANQAEEVIKLIGKGNTDDAKLLVRGGKIPLLKVLAAGIEHRLQAVAAMEAAAIVEIAKMKRGFPVLDTIITLSPLLGLLGTIIGMISSFQVMAIGGMGQPHAVTGGVAEALIATATGIGVAIVSLIPYNYFLSKVEAETAVIEYYATQLEVTLGIVQVRSEKHENSKKSS